MGDDREQGACDVGSGGAQRGAGAGRGGGGRVRPALVHRPRGAPEELRDHARASSQGALDDGMGFDGSSITGFNAIEESDMVAIPDPATFRIMPAVDGEPKIGRMICDVVKPDGEPYEGDPRYVLRRALERMQPDGLRHVQRRPRARVLPLQGLEGHRAARRGRLLRDDGARRRHRPALRDDQGARGGRDPDRVPPPRGRRRRSTRSTCATRPRSRWPTRRSPTG